MTDQLDLFGQVATKAAPIPAATNPRPRRAPHPAGELATKKHWRGIRATWCRACRAPILAGLDADACALFVRVDAAPLTATGEAVSVLGGVDTYTLRHDLARGIALLERRNAAAITRRPAGGPVVLDALTWDVHAEHRCERPTPGPLLAGARVAPLHLPLGPDSCPPF